MLRTIYPRQRFCVAESQGFAEFIFAKTSARRNLRRARSDSASGMDVTRTNFDEGIAMLEEALSARGLEFISIDLEMTGINLAGVNFRDTNTTSDTPAERYAKMRPVATAFGIVQLGISCWRRSSDGKHLRAACFNFYVFPGEAGGDVLVSPGAIKFLSDHGMGFQTWLDRGVPFVDAQREQELRQNRQQRQGNTIVLRNPEDKLFFDRQVASIEAFSRQVGNDASRFASPAASVLLEGHESGLVRAALYKHVEAHFPELATEKSQMNRINVTAAPGVDRRNELELSLQRALGMRRVYKMLSGACAARRVPVVGHNCLYDLMFLTRHFDAPLPESYALWKRQLAAAFPHVCDTKSMALRWQDVESSDLATLYNSLKVCRDGTNFEFEFGFEKYGGPCCATSPETDYAPARPQTEPEDGEIDDTDGDAARDGRKREYADFLVQPPAETARPNFHEAGWDSFTTGVVYCSLLAQLEAQGTRVPVNRLHMMRSPYEICNSLPQDGLQVFAADDFREPLVWTEDANSVCHVHITFDAAAKRTRIRMDDITVRRRPFMTD
ncbi:ribonuclease H-like domain-containing protein [Pelagophyceae sp. CCMP2097]|nr:ribonuclease H-like domain-containing protein [Pelagophyceae sp. CCMP2097]